VLVKAGKLNADDTKYVSLPTQHYSTSCPTCLFILIISSIFRINPVPTNWTEHLNPEGNPYYRHQEFHIVTGAYLREPGAEPKLMAFYNDLKKRTSQLTDSHDLVMDFSADQSSCTYYVADHDDRTIFWLSDANTNQLGLVGVSSGTGLR